MIKALQQEKRKVLHLFNKRPKYVCGDLLPVVKTILEKKDNILSIAAKHKTPLYVIDEEELEKSITSFTLSFKKFLPTCSMFYAVKANHHPYIIRKVVKHGFGLDVSSGRELEIALAEGVSKILFNGPGKTMSELELALKHRSTVTVNIDSFTELKKLGELTQKKKKTIRAGVRIFTALQDSWTKFGIPLEELEAFWNAAKKYQGIRLEGIQFHLSWNIDTEAYRAVIQKIGAYLKKCSRTMRNSIKFIDFGGGFFPDRTEGFYPWTAHYPWNSPLGKIVKETNHYLRKKTQFTDKYYITETLSLETYAQTIAEAFRLYIEPIMRCEYYAEPGRIICNNAMHIILRIVDVKKPNHVIVDGGVNIVGWEYGEHFYFPLVNLTHPSLREITSTVYGPLCTPHDVWGYYCYAGKMCEDDVIAVPYQGAYRYVLAQNFIKPIPPVKILKNV